MKSLTTAISEAFQPVNEESFYTSSKFASEDKLKLSDYKGVDGLDKLFDDVDFGTEKQYAKMIEFLRKVGIDDKKFFKEDGRHWFKNAAKSVNLTDAQADKLIALILSNTKPESYFTYENLSEASHLEVPKSVEQRAIEYIIGKEITRYHDEAKNYAYQLPGKSKWFTIDKSEVDAVVKIHGKTLMKESINEEFKGTKGRAEKALRIFAAYLKDNEISAILSKVTASITGKDFEKLIRSSIKDNKLAVAISDVFYNMNIKNYLKDDVAIDWPKIKLDVKVNESLSDVEPKEGKMRKALGIADDEKIEDVYTDGAKLAQALYDKLGDKKEVTGMLAFAANINKEVDVFDKALKAVKDIKESFNKSAAINPEFFVLTMKKHGKGDVSGDIKQTNDKIEYTMLGSNKKLEISIKDFDKLVFAKESSSFAKYVSEAFEINANPLLEGTKLFVGAKRQISSMHDGYVDATFLRVESAQDVTERDRYVFRVDETGKERWFQKCELERLTK